MSEPNRTRRSPTLSELSDRDWNRHKWAWVEALVQDQPTRGLAHDLAVLLARRYLQADKGRYAWASVRTLAKELGVARRSVIRAFDKLIAGGWLLWEQGGKGSGDSNHYWLPEDIPDPVKGDIHDTLPVKGKGDIRDQEGCHPRPIRVTSTTNKGDAGVTQVSYSESGSREERGSSPLRGDSLSAPHRSVGLGTAAQRHGNPAERVVNFQPRPAASSTQQHGKPAARHQASPRQAEAAPRRAKPNRNARSGKPGGSPFPDGWVLGDAELAIAVSVCGWDRPKAEDQFDTFRAKALHFNWTSHNWPAAWKTFCKRGLAWDAEHPQRHQTLADKYSGLAKGVEREERKRRES